MNKIIGILQQLGEIGEHELLFIFLLCSTFKAFFFLRVGCFLPSAAWPRICVPLSSLSYSPADDGWVREMSEGHKFIRLIVVDFLKKRYKEVRIGHLISFGYLSESYLHSISYHSSLLFEVSSISSNYLYPRLGPASQT